MTFRAVDVLRKVEIIAAEDTRHTRGLLNHFGIAGPRLIALHEHNEQDRSEEIVLAAQAGESIALVSDAGTPVISDPGLSVVRAAWEAGIRLVPVPGASSLTAVLSISPFGAQQARFVGFLPTRKSALESCLAEMAALPGAVVFLEAPHRIVATLELIARLLPMRRILIGRELTKLHETILLGLPDALLPRIQGEHRGEFICILEGAQQADTVSQSGFDPVRLEQELMLLLPPRQVARLLAKVTGADARSIYRRLVEART